MGPFHNSGREELGKEPSLDLSRLQVPVKPGEHCLEGRFFVIRYKVGRADGEPRVVSLEVETRHPQVSGSAPRYSLTPLLRDAYSRSPRTLGQVINPEVAEETRREALGIIVSDIAKNRSLAQEVQRPIRTAVQRPSLQGVLDELEPSFDILVDNATSFADVVKGHCRKEVSVFRNDEVIVRFIVVQGADALVSAEMHALPCNIRWPILDKQGGPVTIASVDEAIHDFTALMRNRRGAVWGVTLHCIAQELERRQRIWLDRTGTIQAEPFLYEVQAVVPDEHIWGEDISRHPVSRSLSPSGRTMQPRVLSDERVVWVGYERSGVTSPVPKLQFAGYSSCGGEYHIEISGPRSCENRLKVMYRDCLASSTWPMLLRAVDTVLRLPGVKVENTMQAAAEHYPQPLNVFIDQCSRSYPTLQIARGVPFGRFSPHQDTNRLRVEHLLRGRSPFVASNVGSSPARSWIVEFALEEGFSGSVCATNALGERVAVELDDSDSTARERRTIAQAIVASMATAPEQLRELILSSPKSFYQVTEIAPAQTMAQVDSVAVKWLRELARAGALRGGGSALDVPWWIERISNDRVNVSILPNSAPDVAWRSRHSFVVGPEGVEAIYISTGHRTFLGLLRGACVSHAEMAHPVAPDDLSVVLRIISSGDASGTQDVLEQSIEAALPHLSLKRGIGMRQRDPSRNDRDLVQIVRNWVGRVFGV